MGRVNSDRKKKNLCEVPRSCREAADLKVAAAVMACIFTAFLLFNSLGSFAFL